MGVFMDTNNAIRAVVKRSGMSLRAASTAMGKSVNYICATLARPGSVEAASLASLAAVCGHAVCLVPLEDVPPSALVIDPPAPAGE